MNRRGFLSMLGLGAVGVAALPLLKKFAPKPEWVEAACPGYRTYVMGKDAMFTALPEKCQMPDDHIHGWCSYKFHMTVSAPPNTNYRIRYIDSQSTLP